MYSTVGRSGILRDSTRVHLFLTIAAAFAGTCLPATAQDAAGNPGGMAQTSLSIHDLALTSIVLGAIAFGVITGVLYVRARAKTAAEIQSYEAEAANLRHLVDRAESLLATEDTAVVSWLPNGRAEIVGQLSGVVSGPRDVTRVLDFPGWLEPASVDAIARRIERLRADGEAFNIIVHQFDGSPVEADGRVRGGRAILRLRHALGERALHGEIEQERDQGRREIEAMRGLLKHVGVPAWARDEDGAVVWANPAYAKLSRQYFNGESGEGRDLMHLGTPLDAANSQRIPSGAQAAELTLKIDEHIEAFDLVECGFEGGSFGLAERRQQRDADAPATSSASLRTLNHIGTGIAHFNGKRRLIFANDAFRTMFDIESRWTMPGADHGQILDVLREGQNIPAEPDYHGWKTAHLRAYDAENTTVDTWHLPDGRTLRVVADPQPNGGLTCLFEDETERLTLESRFNALSRIQRETLENMREAVAVFSSDGRLNFSNPAFARLWHLSADRLSGRPHIENVIFACKPLYGDDATWTTLRHSVTDVADTRRPLSGRMDLEDDRVVDYATVPLPDGATLVTFADITNQIASERMLRERNEALEAAAELKNSFIQHVSYELRTPLTSVIGFAELLGQESTGPLLAQQSEYVDHILSSSDSLLAIINNILDLATIDAGAMELEFTDVDVRQSIELAANGIRGRLIDAGLHLEVHVPEGLGTFVADEARVRQVLFNLFSNAIGFSERGQTITLECARAGDRMRFRVIDQGRGIDPGDFTEIFDRFVTRSGGTSHRGAGLGLSIVKSFVELHGGEVDIASELGQGTTVTCLFPLTQEKGAEAEPVTADAAPGPGGAG